MTLYLNGKAPGPVAQFIGAVLATLLLVGALFVGFFLVAGVVAAAVLAWVGWRARLQWLRWRGKDPRAAQAEALRDAIRRATGGAQTKTRGANTGQAKTSTGGDGEVIDAEYRVVDRKNTP